MGSTVTDRSDGIAKLAGLKHGIYHPRLPSLRKMSMDTITHKLPTEHARTTTNCPSMEFSLASLTTLRKVGGRLHSQGVINTSLNNQMSSYQPLGHVDAWQKVVEKLKAQQTPDIAQDSSGQKLFGYVGRSRHPSVTSSWQHALKNIRPHTARPMPTTMYTRYRDIRTRPQSARPWKS